MISPDPIEPSKSKALTLQTPSLRNKYIFLGPSWNVSRSLGSGALGPAWRRVDAVLGHPGAVLGGREAVLGLWASLKLPLTRLEPIMNRLGPLLGSRRSSLGRVAGLEAILEPPWGLPWAAQGLGAVLGLSPLL